MISGILGAIVIAAIGYVLIQELMGWLSDVDYSASIDRSREAKALFIQLAESYGFQYVIGDDEEGFVEITLPRQKGLSQEIWLNLQNNDELWVAFGEASFSMFPFLEVKDKYLDGVNGWIRGKYRVLEADPPFGKSWGLTQKLKLQKPARGKWETIASCGSLLGWVFYPWRKSVIFNGENEPQLNEVP